MLSMSSLTLALGAGLSGSSVAVPGGAAISATGRSTISYADVATYEAIIGGGSGGQTVHSGLHVAAPTIICNLIKLDLGSNISDEISTYVDDFSSTAAIFQFKGFWPSLFDLHAWITCVSEPLISEITQIYLVARGFFIVKFDTTEDRNTILRSGFSWGEKFPLMAKPWYKDFYPSMESFNKIPLWVRLPNLPLHLWLDSVLEVVGEALRDFFLVNLASSNVF